MICLDTSVLVYAVGTEHKLRAPCQALLQAHDIGQIEATTTVEVIQEFTHVWARRRTRDDAVLLARKYLAALPLLVSRAEDLDLGLTLFGRHPALGAFDSVLAAVALNRRVEALVSADRAFGEVLGLLWIDPGTPALQRLIAR